MIGKFKEIFDWAFRPHFYRGALAERVFEATCRENGLVLIRVPQDKSSFQHLKKAGYGNAKRGDFVIRNRQNAEIEVKCFKPGVRSGSNGYFLKWNEIARQAAGADMTKTPIYFAFLSPSGKRTIDSGSLRMIPLDLLHKANKRPEGVSYVEKPVKGLFIPMHALAPGLTLLDELK